MTSEPVKIKEMAERYTAAWSSRDPDRVARFYAPRGWITINHGPPWQGRDGVRAMAAGFFAEIPDLAETCDLVRRVGPGAGHGVDALFAFTFAGTHAVTANPVRVSGWEVWEMTPDGLILSSRAFYDRAGYDRQVAGEAGG